MSTAAPAVPKPAPPRSAPSSLRLLTARDRCDRCGAQAWVRATLASTGGQLFFCAHHTVEVIDTLFPISREWLDERRFLNEKPSVSASA